MQRRLIDHRTGEQRLAVVFQRDGEAIKPVCPMTTQVALEPDLVAPVDLDVFLSCLCLTLLCTSSPIVSDASRDVGLVNLFETKPCDDHDSETYYR